MFHPKTNYYMSVMNITITTILEQQTIKINIMKIQRVQQHYNNSWHVKYLKIIHTKVVTVINPSAATTLVEQRPGKNFTLSPEFETTTSAMPVQCSPN